MSSFFLGCAIWSYPAWVGELFPRGSKPGDFLSLYSRRFTAVEGNTTFYAIPSAETVEKWAAEAPDSFRFCPKIPREQSHSGLIAPRLLEARAFLERMQLLGVRLGPMLLQLPPSYEPGQLSDLSAFLSSWPREAPISVEVRHRAWFTPRHTLELDKALSGVGAARVLLDSRPVYEVEDDPQAESERKKPRVPLLLGLTAPFTMIRYISHPEPQRNEPYLAGWAERVDAWLRAGTAVYFFVHCPVEERSPAVARRMQALLEARGAPVPPLPWNLIPETGQLKLF
jgi:uncharacterized protein YecE (DUF72 family)